jgi:hypothetical protein
MSAGSAIPPVIWLNYVVSFLFHHQLARPSYRAQDWRD